jgi:hypothetical protein
LRVQEAARTIGLQIQVLNANTRSWRAPPSWRRDPHRHLLDNLQFARFGLT